VFPVLNQAAEYLVIGHLMRRNILAYKAPTNNEGYDLICIHPNPREKTNLVKVQVKSRYQTDCHPHVPMREESLDAFDYLIAVYLNVGNFYRGEPSPAGATAPEFYTVPAAYVRTHFVKAASGFDKVSLKKSDLIAFKNETGFDQIAHYLGIPYPSRIL
jgi:hypothetical protein